MPISTLSVSTFPAAASAVPAVSTAAPPTINQMHVGDQVMAYNEQTGTIGSYTIDAVLVHTDLTLIDLTINGETIRTTPEHPFYTQERGWVVAGEMKLGDHVRKEDGTFGVVQESKTWQMPQPMYNLTVDQAHTFFVGVGQWLVHNCPQKISPDQMDFSEVDPEFPPRQYPGLQQGEGQVSTYGRLSSANAGTNPDVQANHMPSDGYMDYILNDPNSPFFEKQPYKARDGVAMNMETDRHILTRTYGPEPFITENPRTALARDLLDARQIYRSQGVYDTVIRQALLRVIALNEQRFPSLFNK